MLHDILHRVLPYTHTNYTKSVRAHVVGCAVSRTIEYSGVWSQSTAIRHSATPRVVLGASQPCPSYSIAPTAHLLHFITTRYTAVGTSTTVQLLYPGHYLAQSLFTAIATGVLITEGENGQDFQYTRSRDVYC